MQGTRSIAVAIALLCVISAAPAGAQEPAVLGSGQLGDHVYKLYQVPGGIGWSDAAALAEALGGHLAAISSPEENEVLASILDSAIAAGTRCGPTFPGEPYINTWLGLYQNAVGDWVWVTSEPLIYTNWGPGEPNDSGGEDFGMMFCPETGKRGQWNDARSLTPEVPASNQFFAEFASTPTLSCNGFGQPLARGPLTINGNGTLPAKAILLDASGSQVSPTDLAAPPVIQILFNSGSGDPTDVTELALTANQSLAFAFVEGHWHYNLHTSPFTSSGTYTLFLRSGSASDYAVAPTCQASFVVR